MTPRLEKIVAKLNPDQIRELENFAAGLAHNNEAKDPHGNRRLRQDWAGGLSHLKDQYASGLELQKAAIQWRINKEMRDARG